MSPAKIKPAKAKSLDKMPAADNAFPIMKWKPIILIAFGIIVVVLLFFPTQVYFLFYPHTQNDVVNQVFRDREVFSVIQSPQSVSAQLLHSKEGSLDKSQMSGTLPGYLSGTLGGYNKDAPVGLSPDQIQAIQNLLEKPTSYRWGRGNNCIPDYAVLLNFRLQGDTVRVAFCFQCNIIGVFAGDDDSAETINKEYLFDPMRSQLVAISKKIFPNDKEIQALK